MVDPRAPAMNTTETQVPAADMCNCHPSHHQYDEHGGKRCLSCDAEWPAAPAEPVGVLTPTEMDRVAFNLSAEFGPEFVEPLEGFALAAHREIAAVIRTRHSASADRADHSMIDAVRSDAAAAWEKCEERRIENERLSGENNILREFIADIHNKIRHDLFSDIEAAADKVFKALSASEILRQPLSPPAADASGVACPYCGTTRGLRQVHAGYGPVAPEFICQSCFTPTDDGPSFDELPKVDTPGVAPDDLAAPARKIYLGTRDTDAVIARLRAGDIGAMDEAATTIEGVRGENKRLTEAYNGLLTRWAESRERHLAAEAKLAVMREALLQMEYACEQLAATRSLHAYEAMIQCGQAQALLELDNARRCARDALKATPASTLAAPEMGGDLG